MLRTWRDCLCGQRGARSTPRRWPRLLFTDTAPGRRLWLRNAGIKVSELCGARLARISPRGDRADRPQSTSELADLAWLFWRPTRGTLRSTPLGEARFHRRRDGTTPANSKRRIFGVRLSCRAARARFVLSETSRPPLEHVRTGGLGVGVFAANAGRAPSHTVGRGCTSTQPRQVGGYGFELSWV